MTIVTASVITPHQGASWEDLSKLLARGKAKIEATDGVADVQLMVTTSGGPMTNTITFAVAAENWADYAKAQQALDDDEAWTALLIEAAQLASWQIFTSRRLEL